MRESTNSSVQLNLRKCIAVSCAASLLSALACGSGTDDAAGATGNVLPSSARADAGPMRETDDASSAETVGLLLSDQRNERLAGMYVSERDARIGLQFTSQNDNGRIALSLADRNGYELISLEGSPNEGVTLRHGRITLRMAPALVGAAVSAARRGEALVLPDQVIASNDVRAPAADIVVEGELTRFAEVESRPELALVVRLSDALGERGITGDKVPASLPLHAFAMRFASYSPAFGAEAEATRSVRQRVSTARPIAICTPGDIECCSRTPSDPGCKPEPPKPPPSDECKGREPGSDGCYGMCGPGCTCWPNVCGDCCYHPGCAIHDSFCRSCSWLNPLACVACYGPGALAGVVAC